MELKQPRYNSMVKGHWYGDMIGDVDASGSSEHYTGVLGYPITNLTIEGVFSYRVYTKDSKKWGPWIEYGHYDKTNPAGDGSEILAIEINDRTIEYSYHIIGGGWFDPPNDGSFYIHPYLPIDALKIIRK